MPDRHWRALSVRARASLLPTALRLEAGAMAQRHAVGSANGESAAVAETDGNSNRADRRLCPGMPGACLAFREQRLRPNSHTPSLFAVHSARSRRGLANKDGNPVEP